MPNKLAVYTICKNESKYVSKWVECMKEADYMVVLDTGSEDNTMELLEEYSKIYPNLIYKQEKFVPWRFDTARNSNIDMIPEDANILLSIDLDECIQSPGWANLIRESWIDGVHTRGQYMYAWSHTNDGKPARTFFYNKMHDRSWKWRAPVHEYLCQMVDGKPVTTYAFENTLELGFNLLVEHFPDPTKSRGSYLELLEIRVAEDPEDTIAPVYLAHEYYYRGRYTDCIELMDKIIEKNLPYSELEYADFHLFKADSYYQLDDKSNAAKEYLDAIRVFPEFRDPYLRLADMYLSDDKYNIAIGLVKEALATSIRQYSWLEGDLSWSYMPYDILSRCYYFIDDFEKSLTNATVALSYDTENERLKNNLKIIKDKFLKN